MEWGGEGGIEKDRKHCISKDEIHEKGEGCDQVAVYVSHRACDENSCPHQVRVCMYLDEICI